MRTYLPHLLTLCNLLCGCVAVLYAADNQLDWAALFIAIGIFFDFFDGMAARALKVESEVGLQLDSLADVVTSGLAPAVVLVQLFHHALNDSWGAEGYTLSHGGILPLVGLLVAAASAVRLARFNVDTRQTDSFIGLPTPANTLLIVSLPLVLLFQPSETAFSIILNPWLLGALTLLSCFLMNTNLPLFSLKFKKLSWKSNALRYGFLLISGVLLALGWFAAIPLIILLYVLLSLIRRNSA